MKSTVTGDTSGKNLRSFGEILSQSCDVLIVDVFNLFGAEKANFLLSAGTERLLDFLDFFGTIYTKTLSFCGFFLHLRTFDATMCTVLAGKTFVFYLRTKM